MVVPVTITVEQREDRMHFRPLSFVAASTLFVGVAVGAGSTVDAEATHRARADCVRVDGPIEILGYLLSERFPADISLIDRPATCPDDPLAYVLSECALALGPVDSES